MKILKTFTDHCIKIYNIAFFVAPLGIAAFLSLVYMCGGWELIFTDLSFEHYHLESLNHWGLYVLAFLLLVVIMITSIKLIDNSEEYFKNKRLRQVYLCGICFFVCFIIRFLLIYLYREDLAPFSDFRRVWNIANGNLEGEFEYYSLFPTYLNFSVFLRVVIAYFGERFTNVLYINALLCGLTSLSIFLIGYAVFDQEHIGLIASILYAFMPSNIVYTAVGTPEFLAVFFDSFGILCLCLFFAQRSNKGKIVSCILAGVLLGVGASYKSFAAIIVIAFIITDVAKINMNYPDKTFNLKYIATHICCFLVLIVIYKLTSFGILSITENTYNYDLDLRTSIPHYILIGLNTEGEGQISLGNISRLYYKTYLENGHDYKSAKEYAYSLLWDDWAANKLSIIPLFLKKLVWTWQDDIMPFRYFSSSIGINANSPLESFVFNFISRIGVGLAEIYYFFLIISSMRGWARHASEKIYNYRFVFISLIIFGYFCLMLISEAQSRYKCLIMPYVCIIAAKGIETIWRQVKDLPVKSSIQL